MALPSRRQALRHGLAAGAAGLAGCVGGFGSDPGCSTGRTMHESDVAISREAAWPAARRDAANAGVDPDASGPTGDVELAWRQSACTEAASGVVVRDGRVYAGGVVVDGATGRRAGGDWHGHMHTPTVTGGTLYTGAHDLEARDAATGEFAWTFETGVDAGALPASTVSGGTVYVPGSTDDPVVTRSTRRRAASAGASGRTATSTRP